MATIVEVEKFWDTRPCNVRHSTAPLGTAKWSEEVTERKYFVERHIPGFADFPRWRDKNVLEIGCGIGTDTLSFRNAGAHVWAVDVSIQSLALACRRMDLAGFNDVTFSKANAEFWLPGNPSSFDLVYSFGVIHHTPNPDRLLRNAIDKLKPGGELRIMLYAKLSLKNLFREQPEAQAGCPIADVYTGRQARRLLEHAGFQVMSIRKDHIFQWRVKDYIEHRYEMRWPYRMMPQSAFHMLERLAGWHLLITARRPA